MLYLGGGKQQLQFQLVVLELESYTNEIQDLRKWVAKAIPAHPGQIIMTALESEPIVVTFMMSKKHAKAFLKFLHTDDGQIAASRKRIKEILNNGKIIKIGKLIQPFFEKEKETKLFFCHKLRCTFIFFLILIFFNDFYPQSKP